jgi:hypothetical protein
MAKPGPILWFDFQVILYGYMVPLTHTNLKKWREKNNTAHYFRKCNLNNCVQFGFAFSTKVFIRQWGCSSSAVIIVFMTSFYNFFLMRIFAQPFITTTLLLKTTLNSSNLNTFGFFLQHITILHNYHCIFFIFFYVLCIQLCVL